MRRLWFASAVLLLLLTASLVNAWHIRQLTQGVSGQLEQAQLLAQADNWEEAEAVTHRAYGAWAGARNYVYTFLRHTEADQISRDFECVLQYVRLREMDQYAAANADLAAQLELLGEMEQPSLLNVF